MSRPERSLAGGSALIAIGVILLALQAFGPRAPSASVAPAVAPTAVASASSSVAPGVITGLVRGDEGPLARVLVRAYRGADAVASTSTRDDGRFDLNVGPGTYRVRFSPASITFAQQYWNAQDTLADANVVTVGNTPVSLEATLQRTFLIGGRVTAPNGGPAAAAVFPLRAGTRRCCVWPAMGQVSVVTGTYSLRIPSGTYRLLFVPARGFGLAPGWHGGGTTYGEAHDIDVHADRAGLDVQLAAGAFAVTGTITKPATTSVAIYAYPAGIASCCDQLVAVGSDGPSGFSVPLPTGSYFLHFVPSTGASRWWNDAPTLSGARPITVSADVTGIDTTFR